MSQLEKRRLILGVDGGGTRTTAWLGYSVDEILGTGKSGPSNAKAVGVNAAKLALCEAIDQAFIEGKTERRPVDVGCLGLAGFDREDDRRLLWEWNRRQLWADDLVFASDGELVVAAGTPEGWGIGVIAGTGSIAVGRDREGRKARAGGWGHLMGDEGSAYAVVLAALRYTARRADGRDPVPFAGDRLGKQILKALVADSPSQIVSAIYSTNFDKARIASLAPVVIEAANEDADVVAKILGPAGADLAEMVIAVARSLGLPRGSLPLALAGSFLLGSDVVVNSLLNGLESAGFHPMVTRVPEPVRGAMLIAQRRLVRLTEP